MRGKSVTVKAPRLSAQAGRAPVLPSLPRDSSNSDAILQSDPHGCAVRCTASTAVCKGALIFGSAGWPTRTRTQSLPSLGGTARRCLLHHLGRRRTGSTADLQLSQRNPLKTIVSIAEVHLYMLVPGNAVAWSAANLKETITAM
jgi:hypothetical protein